MHYFPGQRQAIKDGIKKGQALLTPEVIMRIARTDGEFSVDWQYRNSWLMDRCNRLCKERRLFRKSQYAGVTVFVLSNKEKRAMAKVAKLQVAAYTNAIKEMHPTEQPIYNAL